MEFYFKSLYFIYYYLDVNDFDVNSLRVGPLQCKEYLAPRNDKSFRKKCQGIIGDVKRNSKKKYVIILRFIIFFFSSFIHHCDYISTYK